MIVNFRTREISRGAHKLTRTLTLKKKIQYYIPSETYIHNIFNVNIHSTRNLGAFGTQNKHYYRHTTLRFQKKSRYNDRNSDVWWLTMKEILLHLARLSTCFVCKHKWIQDVLLHIARLAIIRAKIKTSFHT
jgi:hypothetical protein